MVEQHTGIGSIVRTSDEISPRITIMYVQAMPKVTMSALKRNNKRFCPT